MHKGRNSRRKFAQPLLHPIWIGHLEQSPRKYPLCNSGSSFCKLRAALKRGRELATPPGCGSPVTSHGSGDLVRGLRRLAARSGRVSSSLTAGARTRSHCEQCVQEVCCQLTDSIKCRTLQEHRGRNTHQGRGLLLQGG